MAKLKRQHQWIKDELEAALDGEVEIADISLDDQHIHLEGRIYCDGSPEETREFLEALAAEAVPGHTVTLDGVFVTRDVPAIAIAILKRTAQTPRDIYFIETLAGDTSRIKAHVRHQDKFLGKKRNRLVKAHELLGKEGINLEAVPLGSQDDASSLRTLPLVQEWLDPLLAQSPLSSGHVHAYKADANGEKMLLVYDAEIEPDALRGLAQRIALKTDILVSFERRMSKARARQVIDEAFNAAKWAGDFSVSFQDKGQAFVITVDAEKSHEEDLRELVRELEQITQGRVIAQIDVAKDVMVSRLLDTFPEDGIVTNLKHVDAKLYEIEAAIPFDHGNERLTEWSDSMEAQWGARIMISDPFLRAPDIRYRHFLGEDKETIAKRYNLSVEFSDEVQAEAEAAASFDIEEEAAKPYRRDIRHVAVMSIDPERTRDLDDALSIEKKDDVYEIGVHIADVAHFVPQGSALDNEALKRGFTCYLKEGEIPVLPVVIANQAASLHGSQDSLALSVIIRMDEDAEVISFEVAKTVIHNHCRFSYAGAQAILDGKDDEHAYAWQIKTLGALSRKLRGMRKATGALDLNLDDDPEKASHQLIEEFMLLANELVGRKLRESHPQNLCLYRTHPDVTEVSFEGLNKLSEHFRLGVTIKDQGSMQTALEAAAKTEYFDIFRFHVGRTLEKAIYHVEQLGHGALAKEDYAHFTSPIRRYTDLIIHRLLEDIIFGEERGHTSSYHKEDMRSAIDHLNMMEIRVDAGSFESHRLADLQQYDGVRRTYTGRILSFMRGWVTVALHQTDLRVSARYRDYNATDPMPVSINDEFTQQWYSLGDEVRVRTEGVNWGSKNIKAQLVKG